jgi:hypothetical protein
VDRDNRRYLLRLREESRRHERQAEEDRQRWSAQRGA